MFRAWLVILSAPALIAACGGSATPAGSATSAGAGSPGAAQPPASQEVNPGGDIPDTQAYVAYALPSGAVTVKVPEGWARVESGGGATFTSHYNSVAITTVAAGSAPTTSSAAAVEVAMIKRQSSNVVIGTVTQVARTAGQAILITYQADSPADPVTGHFARVSVERYEFWHNGVEAVITLAAPVGADNVDPWRTITDSLTWR